VESARKNAWRLPPDTATDLEVRRVGMDITAENDTTEHG
jgi:hypothetical protein